MPSAWALHPKILQLRIKHMFASVIQFLHASVVCVNEYIYIKKSTRFYLMNMDVQGQRPETPSDYRLSTIN